MGDYLRVEIPRIENLSISFKKGTAKISFEAASIGPGLLKLIFMQATATPMSVIIESPQASMDLYLKSVDIKTGEVVDDLGIPKSSDEE